MHVHSALVVLHQPPADRLDRLAALIDEMGRRIDALAERQAPRPRHNFADHYAPCPPDAWGGFDEVRVPYRPNALVALGADDFADMSLYDRPAVQAEAIVAQVDHGASFASMDIYSKAGF
jgi:hypothetical protein